MAGGIAAQVQTQPTAVDDSAEIETELEEIVIRGQQRPPWGELRLEIERAQEALYARFNAINSTDDFDIDCWHETSSHRRNRRCMSNSARDLESKMWLEALRDNIGGAQLFALQAALRERELNEELRQLATSDEQLKQTVARLGQAQLAYALSRGNTTLARQVSATLGELPYDAERLFEVIMGNDPWRHPLTQRTFTIADVFGEIRKLGLECSEGSERIDYEVGVDWTVPSDQSACVLQVHAKKGTTFRLYEF